MSAVARQYPKPEGWVAFGIADAEILPPLESALLAAAVPVFNPEGRSRRQEGLYQLLAGLAALLREPTFATVEALARCPDFMAYLRRKAAAKFAGLADAAGWTSCAPDTCQRTSRRR